MWNPLPETWLIVPAIFTIVSINVCAVQIFLRKKVRLLTVCRVSIFLPVLSLIGNNISDISDAYMSVSVANDLPTPIVNEGLSVLFANISFGLYITIFLAILYAITAAIVENQKR